MKKTITKITLLLTFSFVQTSFAVEKETQRKALDLYELAVEAIKGKHPDGDFANYRVCYFADQSVLTTAIPMRRNAKSLI